MAVYNEILVGRFNRALQKLLSMKGPAAMNMLAPELQAQIAFQMGVETALHQGWERFGAGGDIAAVAAQSGIWQLRNPTGSGVVAVVEGILEAAAGAAASTRAVLSSGAATGGVLLAVETAGRGWDSRSVRNSSLFLSTATQAAVFSLGNSIINYSRGTADFQLISQPDQEIPILPGQALASWGGAVNTDIFFGIWWRERILEDSEKTG